LIRLFHDANLECGCALASGINFKALKLKRGRKLAGIESAATNGFYTPLFAEQPKQQRKHEAYNQARDNREMKAEVAFGVINVAWKFSKPASSDTRP
jgi:hypothetical protein